jgi:predicted DNA-binding transcriptional regulator YafY
MSVPSDNRPPREKGFSKDADKLVRRLSLVAFLLCRHGRPATADEIRRRVEGYALMTDEAFKRRFYEDRAELGELGIAIVHQSDETGGGDLYSLHSDGYYLPAIEFSADELSALATCLFVLGDRFAYSEPLRLALLSLTHDRPELLADEPAAPVSILPEADAQRAAAALPKVQEAVAARKTIRFSYYSIARDAELKRTVDPYSLLVVGDEWYLIGRCHLRDAVRTFRLSRLRSPVRFATKAPHDFAPPPAFELAAYVDRPPWQLGPATGQATVRVSPAMAWWVEAHYGNCGTIVPAADGRIAYTTDYHTARQLLAWTLSMGEDAELVSPARLRAEIGAQLRRLSARLDAPPLPADEAAVHYATTVAEHPAPAARRRRVRAAHDWQVEVDRFTRLTTLMTYLEHACRTAGGDDEVPLAIDRVSRDLDLTRDDLVADVRLLNLVNFGGEGTLVWAVVDGDDLVVTCEYASQAFARPGRLSPLQVDTLLLAVELLGGQLPTEHGAGGGPRPPPPRPSRRRLYLMYGPTICPAATGSIGS